MTRASPLDTTLTLRLREFAFGDEDFEALRKLVKDLTGISLTEQKRELVYGRLSRRLRALKLDSFAEYRQLLASNDAELVHLCNAITTNLTAFFREPHHFVYLRDQILRPLAADRAGTRRHAHLVRGLLDGRGALLDRHDRPRGVTRSVRLGHPHPCDRSRLRCARAGPSRRVSRRAGDGVLIRRALRAFSRHSFERGMPSYEVVPELRALISFKQLNLMHALPMKGPLDTIFCRNMVIYFDKDTQRELFTSHGATAATGRSAVPGPLRESLQGIDGLHAHRQNDLPAQLT